MSKFSVYEEQRNIVQQYVERFGEDALIPYISDIDDATKAYKRCLEEDKSYEELYGVKFDKNVLY